jgi:protein O-mannosyl-transferase
MADIAQPFEAKRSRLWQALLLLASFLLYANTLVNGFVSDDHQQIEGNPYAHSFRYVGKIFTTTVWSFQGHEGRTNYYRPLMTFGYVLSDKLFQTYPFGFHLVNLFLHCLVVWLVFRLGKQALADERIAFGAALLFAFHPIHSEAVAWIAAVTELQLAVFFLLAFLLYLRLHEPGAKPFTYVLTWTSFLLALLAKEQAVTLPVLATLHEHLYGQDRAETNWLTKLRRYGGFWVLAGAYLLFRILVLAGFAPVVQRPDLTPGELVLSGLALVGQYAAKLFWPHPLVRFYLFQKTSSLWDRPAVVDIAAIAIFLALFVALWKYARPYSFWLMWIGVTLAPVLNVRWMAASAFSERYLYLPSVGFCILLAAGAVGLWQAAGHLRVVRAAAWSAAIAVLGASAVSIVLRNRQWHDDETLVSRDLAIEPHASYLRADIGAIEWSRHRKAQAIEQWKLALRDKPDNAIALCNLGMAMVDQKDWQAAEEYLKEAIVLRPNFASPHVYWGDLHVAEGQFARAEAEYRRAVEISPLNTEARNRLGGFYQTQGRRQEAEEQFRASAEAQPNIEAWNGLGDVLLARGRPGEAVAAWAKVTELMPFDEHARLQLGQVYHAQGRPADAEEQFRVVLLLDPKNEIARSVMHEIKPDEFPAP